MLGTDSNRSLPARSVSFKACSRVGVKSIRHIVCVLISFPNWKLGCVRRMSLSDKSESVL